MVTFPTNYLKYYVRYTDDFVVLSHNRSELLGCLTKIASFLSESLALDLHPDKVYIKSLASGVDFLGWVHFSHHRVPRRKTRIRMFKSLGGCQNRQVIASYIGLLSHGNAYGLTIEMENLWWLLLVDPV